MTDRNRRILLGLVIASVPLTMEIGEGDNYGPGVLLAASDAILPLIIAGLGLLLLKGMLRIPNVGALCAVFCAVVISFLGNLEDILVSRGPLFMGLELVKVTVLSILFLAMANLIRSREDLALALKTWLVTSVFVTLSGILGVVWYFYTGQLNRFSLQFRAQGTLSDCNAFGAYCSLTFFLAIFYFSLTRRKWALALLPLYVAGLILSASRGSLLAFCCALVLLALVTGSLQRRWVGVAAVGCLAATFVSLGWESGGVLEGNPIAERLATTTVSLEESAASDRVILWNAAWSQFMASPVWGVGRFNFRWPVDSQYFIAVHNTYLGLLCEAGLLGFTAYFTVFLRYPLTILFRLDKPAKRFLLLATLSMLLSAVTVSFENFRVLWVLTGLSESYWRLYAADAA